MLLVEGETLLCKGRYRFEKVLDTGTFSWIFCALDLETNQFVAIKCMLEKSFNRTGEHEAKILTQINQRDPFNSIAVIRILGTFWEKKHFCTVLELLGDPVTNVYNQQQEGKKSIKSKKPKRWRIHELRQMAVHLCGALCFLHEQCGLIHADLKPQNILLTFNNNNQVSSLPNCKLIDFGNTIEPNQIEMYETQDFQVQTLSYRAPEVAAGWKISSAMDLWSFGCILLECLTGQPVFAARKSVELLDQIERLMGQKLAHVVPEYAEKACFYPDLVVYQRQLAQKNSNGENSIGSKSSRPNRERLWHLIQHYGSRGGDGSDAGSEGREEEEFCDFLMGLLDVNPMTRMNARQALFHPFLQRFFPFRHLFCTTGINEKKRPFSVVDPNSYFGSNSNSNSNSVSDRNRRQKLKLSTDQEEQEPEEEEELISEDESNMSEEKTEEEQEVDGEWPDVDVNEEDDDEKEENLLVIEEEEEEEEEDFGGEFPPVIQQVKRIREEEEEEVSEDEEDEDEEHLPDDIMDEDDDQDEEWKAPVDDEEEDEDDDEDYSPSRSQKSKRRLPQTDHKSKNNKKKRKKRRKSIVYSHKRHLAQHRLPQ